MMQIDLVLNGKTIKAPREEAGKILKAMKAAGFRLDPTFSRQHYEADNKRAIRFVTRNYFRKKEGSEFEFECFSVMMYNADWYTDRH